MKQLILITGPPKIGKTTVLLKTVQELTNRGLRLGGLTSAEARHRGLRVGFRLRDLLTGEEGWLAHVHFQTGPRIGKYRVNLSDLNSVGVASILNAIIYADVVVIDEIGPMELLSQEFQSAVLQAANAFKPTISTIHYRAHHPVVTHLKSREDADVIEVTKENRSQLPALIVNKTLTLFESPSS